jgi:ATP-dependent RNA helicase SUPV3L1/SUV3
MDINEIYFSNLKKFDGKKTRRLNLIEMSQIAGRAGRFKNDGGFGTTGDCENLNSDEIENIEKHQLPETKIIYWRNSRLNFESPDKLIASLELKPVKKNLLRTNDSLDESVLRHFLKKGANNILYHKNLELLWECCQIPDFEKKAYGQHIGIIDKVFQFLSTRKKKIPSTFMKEQLKGLEKDHGNVDLLSHRLSNVRTWSYVANKKNWVENSDYWVQLTKSIEDKLSDKLHEELTKSFIDKKISILSRSLKQDLVLNTKINEENKMHIDGQLIGELKGLKFIIELTSKTLDTDIKSIKKAARRGIKEELDKRVNEIIDNKEISIDSNSKIIWKASPIAKLKKGNDYLSPEIDVIADESLELETKLKLEEFLKRWLDNYIDEILGNLINLTKQKIENQYLRALLFQLYEKNGVIKRSEIDNIVKLIPTEERRKLWGMGIKIGRYHVYLPKMLKPKAVEFRISLWKIFYNLANEHEIPKSGLNFIINKNYEKNFLLLCGFEKFKDYFIRIDILEKLFIKILDNSKDRRFKINAEMMNLLGCTKENFYKLMTYMNYKKDKSVDTYIFKGEIKKADKFIKFDKKENPFKKLLSLNIK